MYRDSDRYSNFSSCFCKEIKKEFLILSDHRLSLIVLFKFVTFTWRSASSWATDRVKVPMVPGHSVVFDVESCLKLQDNIDESHDWTANLVTTSWFTDQQQSSEEDIMVKDTAWREENKGRLDDSCCEHLDSRPLFDSAWSSHTLKIVLETCTALTHCSGSEERVKSLEYDFIQRCLFVLDVSYRTLQLPLLVGPVGEQPAEPELGRGILL